MRRLIALVALPLTLGAVVCVVAPQSSASRPGGDVGGVTGTAFGRGSESGGTAGAGRHAEATGPGEPSVGYPELRPCGGPSVDHLEKWFGTAEGPTIPGEGSSLLVADGDGYKAKVKFAYAPNWHVAPVWVTNEFKGVDLSTSTELRIEYSATSDLFVQLRPESTYSGGDKWHAPLPSTNGRLVTKTIPLTPDNWVAIFGTPPVSLAQTLTELLGVVFVGNTKNELVVKSLRFNGYTPPCLD